MRVSPLYWLRFGGHLAWLAFEVARSAIRFLPLVFSRQQNPLARAQCLSRCSRRTLRPFGARPKVFGDPPKAGLLVTNHLSYLDILLLASAAPCLFVAKSEVARWPVFGWFARTAGAIFIDRNKRADVARVVADIRDAIQAGALVVIFPEGTSSNGGQVLPFKSSLLAVAEGQEFPISIAYLSYHMTGGDAGTEVCWWGDMLFVPHLLNLLGKRGYDARLWFKPSAAVAADRKALAKLLHQEVLSLKNTATFD